MCSVNDFPTSRAVAHDPREAQPVFEQPWSDKWPVQLLRERSDDRGRRPPPPHSLGRWPLLIRRNFIDSDRYIRTWWRPSPTPRICPPYSLGGFPSAYLSVCLAVSMCTSRFHIFLNLCRGVFVSFRLPIFLLPSSPHSISVAAAFVFFSSSPSTSYSTSYSTFYSASWSYQASSLYLACLLLHFHHILLFYILLLHPHLLLHTHIHSIWLFIEWIVSDDAPKHQLKEV